MQTHMTMKQLPPEGRPYERCLSEGPGVLSDTELLAVILRSGAAGVSSLELAGRILNLCPHREGLAGLMHLTVADLKTLPGIGNVKAVQLQCVGELSRRIARGSIARKPLFRDPDAIADYYMERLRHSEQERVFCLMLDNRNRLLGECEVSRGTVNASLFSVRDIFLKAFSYHAVHIAVIHNHPSGEPLPSFEDLQATRRLIEAGDMLGIPLLDHVIVGDRCFASIRRTNPDLFSCGASGGMFQE